MGTSLPANLFTSQLLLHLSSAATTKCQADGQKAGQPLASAAIEMRSNMMAAASNTLHDENHCWKFSGPDNSLEIYEPSLVGIYVRNLFALVVLRPNGPHTA